MTTDCNVKINDNKTSKVDHFLQGELPQNSFKMKFSSNFTLNVFVNFHINFSLLSRMNVYLHFHVSLMFVRFIDVNVSLFLPNYIMRNVNRIIRKSITIKYFEHQPMSFESYLDHVMVSPCIIDQLQVEKKFRFIF